MLVFIDGRMSTKGWTWWRASIQKGELKNKGKAVYKECSEGEYGCSWASVDA